VTVGVNPKRVATVGLLETVSEYLY